MSSIDQEESVQFSSKKEEQCDVSDESIIHEFDIQLNGVNKKKKQMRGPNDIERQILLFEGNAFGGQANFTGRKNGVQLYNDSHSLVEEQK